MSLNLYRASGAAQMLRKFFSLSPMWSGTDVSGAVLGETFARSTRTERDDSPTLSILCTFTGGCRQASLFSSGIGHFVILRELGARVEHSKDSVERYETWSGHTCA